MKISRMLSCALALSMAFAAGKVSAVSTTSSGLATLSVSATAEFFKTNYFTLERKGTNIVSTNEVFTTMTRSLNNKYIYNLISNAVANASDYDTNLVSTHLPAGGSIAFSSGSDGRVSGFFYVTNKPDFAYPLSGLDAATNYYSFIELDTTVPYFTLGVFGSLGFNGDNFNYFYDVFSDNYNTDTGNSSPSSTSLGVLYIHDNPSSYDLPANLATYRTNTAAIEIWGNFRLGLTYRAGNITQGLGTLRGSGNIISTVITTDTNYDSGVITSGTATLSFKK